MQNNEVFVNGKKLINITATCVMCIPWPPLGWLPVSPDVATCIP